MADKKSKRRRKRLVRTSRIVVPPAANDNKPTPEFLERRRERFGGDAPLNVPGDPLGVLVFHDIIGSAERDAGLRFANLRGRAFVGFDPSAKPVNMTGAAIGTAANDNANDRSLSDYHAARAALESCGKRVAQVVEAVAVYENEAAAFDVRNVRRIKRGLAALCVHFAGE